ncbi:MAG: hypothetical protein ACE5EV_08810, partial [Gaiellales bacterium]
MPADIPLVGPLVNRIFGSRNERLVRRYNQRVERISALEPQMRALTDAELRAMTPEFRSRVEQGATAEDILVEAFAVAREVMDRAVGIRNIFDPKLRDQFPVDQLSPEHRALYDKTRSDMDAAEPKEPTDELLGCDSPQPGWVWNDIPRELYDAVREIYPESKPPFRARPFDVQLIGGMVLYQGSIAEMKTGEGKTLVATLPLYLNALEGKGVHVITVNDYLAKRDAQWMGQIYHSLGLSVGVLQHDTSYLLDPQANIDDASLRYLVPATRKGVYNADITYGTNNEFGFDYLRDNMAVRLEDRVQRGHVYTIVDEVDSVLIDEARTPLIISGPVQQSIEQFSNLKPAVERVVHTQTRLVNDILLEVEKLRHRLEGEADGGEPPARDRQRQDGDDDEPRSANDIEAEIGYKLLTAQRGAAKNRRLLKLYAEDPGLKKLMQRTEGEVLRDKRMHELDENLYYVIDEKNHVSDLSDQGRELLSPQDKEFFILPDLAVDLDRIQHDESLSAGERVQQRDALYRLYAERSDRIH